MNENFSDFHIVTLVDTISATSMPINEFVLYRDNKGYGCKQTIIVLEDTKNQIDMNNGNVYIVNKSLRKIRVIVESIEKKRDNINIIYHIHHPKIGIFFYIATLGLNIKSRVLFTIHSSFNNRNIKYQVSSFICSLLADKINCVSKSAYEDYSSVIKKIRSKDFYTISNGVDYDRVQKLSANSTLSINRMKKLLCIGRLIPIKNQEFLINLLRLLPGYELTLVGTGCDLEKMRELACSLNLGNRCFFTGLLPRNEVFKLLENHGIYLSASIVEGLPISVLEAMSAGLVPVLSDIKPHLEIKEYCDYVTTLPFNESLWRKRILELSNLENKELENYSKKIKADTVKFFSLDSMHEKYFELYSAMCKKGKV